MWCKEEGGEERRGGEGREGEGEGRRGKEEAYSCSLRL